MKKLTLILSIIFVLTLSGCTKVGIKSGEPTTTLTPVTTITENTTINPSTSIQSTIPVTTLENTTTSSTTLGSKVDGILLELEYIDIGKIKLLWDVVGESPQGFRIIWSKASNPAYPLREGDEFQYIRNSNVREMTIANLDNSTYYFRICEYLGEECGVYSNEVSHTAGATTTSTTSSTSTESTSSTTTI